MPKKWDVTICQFKKSVKKRKNVKKEIQPLNNYNLEHLNQDNNNKSKIKIHIYKRKSEKILSQQLKNMSINNERKKKTSSPIMILPADETTALAQVTHTHRGLGTASTMQVWTGSSRNPICSANWSAAGPSPSGASSTAAPSLYLKETQQNEHLCTQRHKHHLCTRNRYPHQHHLCTWNSQRNMNTIFVQKKACETWTPSLYLKAATEYEHYLCTETATRTGTPSLYIKLPWKHELFVN